MAFSCCSRSIGSTRNDTVSLSSIETKLIIFDRTQSLIHIRYETIIFWFEWDITQSKTKMAKFGQYSNVILFSLKWNSSVLARLQSQFESIPLGIFYWKYWSEFSDYFDISSPPHAFGISKCGKRIETCFIVDTVPRNPHIQRSNVEREKNGPSELSSGRTSFSLAAYTSNVVFCSRQRVAMAWRNANKFMQIQCAVVRRALYD